MFLSKHEHNRAFKIIPEAIWSKVEQTIKHLSPSLNYRTIMLRKTILDDLSQYGWSDQIRITADSKITITSSLNDIGLCLQTGNMSRFYADLLKLQALNSMNKIKGGIYLIPTKHESRNIGSNVAHFDRFVEELQVFSDILTIPLIVYGFERGA
jgi:hypothetical protein